MYTRDDEREMTFGPLSSVFDFATFGVLLWLTRGNPAREALFQTGWFVESILSATLVVFVLRTRGSPWRSRPSRAMMAMTVVVAAVVVVMPYSPLPACSVFKRCRRSSWSPLRRSWSCISSRLSW